MRWCSARRRTNEEAAVATTRPPPHERVPPLPPAALYPSLRHNGHAEGVRDGRIAVAIRKHVDNAVLVSAGVGCALARRLVRPGAWRLVDLGAGVPQHHGARRVAGDRVTLSVEQLDAAAARREEDVVRLSEHDRKVQPVAWPRCYCEGLVMHKARRVVALVGEGLDERPRVAVLGEALKRSASRHIARVENEPFL